MSTLCLQHLPASQCCADAWERQFHHWLYRQPEAQAMVTATAYRQQTGSFHGWPHQLRQNVVLYQQARSRYGTTVAPEPTHCRV